MNKSPGRNRPKNWKHPIPPDAVVEFTETPHEDVDDYELPDEVPLDPSKFRPNRFAGKIKYTARGGARKGAGRKPGPEPLVAKKVYLTPRHIKFFAKIDKNLSAAIRKLADTQSK